jgi:hypothetical protein
MDAFGLASARGIWGWDPAGAGAKRIIAPNAAKQQIPFIVGVLSMCDSGFFITELFSILPPVNQDSRTPGS